MITVFAVGYVSGFVTLIVAALIADAKKRGKAMQKELEKQKLERWLREVYAPGFEFIELPREKYR